MVRLPLSCCHRMMSPVLFTAMIFMMISFRVVFFIILYLSDLSRGILNYSENNSSSIANTSFDSSIEKWNSTASYASNSQRPSTSERNCSSRSW